MPLSTSIKDICVPLSEYPNIRDSATLRDAFAILHAEFAGGKRYRHILVLNEQDQLVGLLAIRDILHGMFPDYLRTPEHASSDNLISDFPALTLIWAETCHSQCPLAANKEVRDFMSPIPGKVGINDPLTTAAYLLVTHNTSILPVVDGDRLVGVVRMIDVFNEAAEVVLHG